MKNIYNNDLIEIILDKIPNVNAEKQGNKLVIMHEYDDWDFITILAQRLGFYCVRWMENQEPRTTIWLS